MTIRNNIKIHILNVSIIYFSKFQFDMTMTLKPGTITIQFARFIPIGDQFFFRRRRRRRQ